MQEMAAVQSKSRRATPRISRAGSTASLQALFYAISGRLPACFLRRLCARNLVGGETHLQVFCRQKSGKWEPIALLYGRITSIERDDPRGTKYVVEGMAVDRQAPVGVVGRFTRRSRYLIITVYKITPSEM